MAILVAGGTKGIGLAIARPSQDAGDVFLGYHGDTAAADMAAEAVAEAGGRSHLVKADAGTPEGCAVMAEAARTVAGRLDQVVHCAVDAYASAALSADPARFARAVTTNGTSLLFLVQAVLPLLSRGSTVFYLTSRGGRIVVPNYAAIGIAKALAESLLRYLAVELAREASGSTRSRQPLSTPTLSALCSGRRQVPRSRRREPQSVRSRRHGRGLHQPDALARFASRRVHSGAGHFRQRRRELSAEPASQPLDQRRVGHAAGLAHRLQAVTAARCRASRGD